MKKKGYNILQLEAKDLFNIETIEKEDDKGNKYNEYNYIYTKDIKKDNYKKYKAVLDYSLEIIKLESLEAFKSDIIEKDDKLYSNDIISVKFKYNAEFDYVNKNDEVKTKKVKTGTLREDLYEKGFTITFTGEENVTKTYVRYKRSSGSARVGKCLFINVDLFEEMNDWSMMGLEFNKDEKIDLASLEAYKSLTLSSIIDTLEIEAKNILVIPERFSTFTDTVNSTYLINNGKNLETKTKEVEITNNIWDGQGLIDKSLMGKYDTKGMLLLRNQYFKGCCFNTNLQEYFKSQGVKDISGLNGIHVKDAKLEDIKLVITESCIKYCKFGTVEDWLNKVNNVWGICKYDKKTHHFDGRLVQTHYQLLNTLQFDEDEVKELLKESVDYIKAVKYDPVVMRKYLKLDSENEDEVSFNGTNEFIMHMLKHDDDFKNTKLFKEFRDDVFKKMKRNLLNGHILVKGNYSVLFGNPMEMLEATVKDVKKEAITLIEGTIYSKNFDYEEELLGSRSPHVTMGNILVAKNASEVRAEILEKWFNLTKEIVCVNSIGENTLERLSSADFDSDMMLLTNNKMLVKKAKMKYDKFLVPTSAVQGVKHPRYNTAKELADLDIKTSNNLIGNIINSSQQLNSILWDKLNNGSSIDDEDIKALYRDICQLDVLSCIEIDKAKKEFEISSNKELEAIMNKYKKVRVHEIKDDKYIEVTDKDIISIYKKMMSIRSTTEREEFKKKHDLEKYTHLNVKTKFFGYLEDSVKFGENEDNSKPIYFTTENTTMNYLVDYVTSKKFTSDTRAAKVKKYIKILDLCNEKYKAKDADRHEVLKVKDIALDVKKYVQFQFAINMNNLSKEEIKEKCKERYENINKKKLEAIEGIRSLNLSASTIYNILYRIDKEKDDFKTVARTILSLLFEANKEEFYELFSIDNKNTLKLEYLRRTDKVTEDEIIEYYGIKFYKKNIGETEENEEMKQTA